MPDPKFYCSKFARKLKYEKPELRDAFIAGLKPNIRYIETLKKYVPKRSDHQNKYYWGVVVKMISDETGMDKDSTHDALRMKFLKVEFDKLSTIKSTAKLSMVEFKDYIEQCVIWAAEFLGIVIPDPYLVDF